MDPMDTYEISDKEDSGDEEAVVRAEAARERKHVPAWVEGFDKVVVEQAKEGVDPDTIFGGRVPHCNVDTIFPDSLYRQLKHTNPRRRRGSSCLWMRDRLRSSEVHNYREKMGQNRRWSVLRQKTFMQPAGIVKAKTGKPTLADVIAQGKAAKQQTPTTNVGDLYRAAETAVC